MVSYIMYNHEKENLGVGKLWRYHARVGLNGSNGPKMA